MKSIFKYTFFITLSTLIVSCAQEETKVCRIEKVYDNDTLRKEFIYENNMIAEINTYNIYSNFVDYRFDFERGPDNKIDKCIVYHIANNPWIVIVPHYDAFGRMWNCIGRIDANDDGHFETPFVESNLFYNDDYKVDSIAQVYYQMGQITTQIMTWDGENIGSIMSRTDSNPWITTTYTYDSNKNPYYNIKDEEFITNWLMFEPKNMSVNNVITFNKAIGSSTVESANYNYAYNGDGQPQTNWEGFTISYGCY